MANQERGEVGVEVNGKRYTLRPTLNAICELEELVGKDFIEIARGAERGRLAANRMLIWAYLQDRHSDEIKTLADAGRWMQDAGGLDAIAEKLKVLGETNAPPPAEGVNGAERPLEAQSGLTGDASTETRVDLPH